MKAIKKSSEDVVYPNRLGCNRRDWIQLEYGNITIKLDTILYADDQVFLVDPNKIAAHGMKRLIYNYYFDFGKQKSGADSEWDNL